MLYFLLVFLISLVATLLLTPAVRNFALKKSILDKPNSRKVHSSPVPVMGGAAIYFGFLLSSVVGYLLFRFLSVKANYPAVAGIIVCATLMFLIGMLDDIKGIGAFTKLFLQVAVASFTIYFGVEIEFITNPFNGILPLGYLAVPLTLFWIVGVTNSINLIDGLDGLAAGVTVIAAAALFIVALRLNMLGSAMLLAALAGASLGFLRYNFNPASIFLGDSGSLFLGYVLAAASILGVLKSTLVIAFIIPVLVLGVPIFDTLNAIFRRAYSKKHIFHADNEHLHHDLIKAGLSHREAVLAIYLIGVLLAAGSLIISALNSVESLLILAVIISFAVVGMIKIKRSISRNAQGE